MELYNIMMVHVLKLIHFFLNKWCGYLPTIDILSKLKYREEEEKINVSLIDNLDF
jgi:hypothetical protein